MANTYPASPVKDDEMLEAREPSPVFAPTFMPAIQSPVPFGRPALPLGPFNEPYIPRSGPVDPTQWGMPDYILQGAQRYPGIAPGPYMPQKRDMRGLLSNASLYFSKNGSNPMMGLAGTMGMWNDKWAKEYVAGREAAGRIAEAETRRHQQQLADKVHTELRDYSDLHATYLNEPEVLRQKLTELAYKNDDDNLLHVLQTEGVKGAERVMSDRHNQWSDLVSATHQQLENDKLRRETSDADDAEKRYNEIMHPERSNQPEAQTARQGTPYPEVSEATRETPEGVAGRTNPAPEPKSGAAAAPGTPASDRPTAPEGGSPTGLTRENLPQRAQEAADWATRNGVARPPADAAGLNAWADRYMTPNGGLSVGGAPAPASPGPGTAPETAPTDRVTPPPESPGLVHGGGFANQKELDFWAFRFLKTGTAKNPQTSVSKQQFSQANLENQAIFKRASQIEEWMGRMARNTDRQPNLGGERANVENALALLDQFKTAIPDEESTFNYIGQIIKGQEKLPGGTGLGGQNKFAIFTRELVFRFDPTFTERRFDTNKRVAVDYSPGGRMGQRINGFKTVFNHYDITTKLLKDLDPSDIIIYNRLTNELTLQAGGAKSIQLNNAYQIYSTEIAKTFKGSQTTLREIEDFKKSLNANMSKDQAIGVMRTLLEFGNGQFESLTDDYNRVTYERKKPEEWFDDPRLRENFKLVRTTPLLASERARIERARRVGANPFTPGTVPPEANDYIDYVRQNRGSPDPVKKDRAAKILAKLQDLGWIPDDFQ
jgi:hypothetical protein